MSHTNYTSTGCPAHEVLPHDPVPFFSGGELNFKAHDVGWLCCIFLTLVSTATSVWLIKKHLRYFYHPREQRHIVRLLLMPPIYSIASTLSYVFYGKALYFQLIRDCYEAFIIASFFFLLLSYLSNPVPTRDNPHPQPFATKAERQAQLRSVVKDLQLDKWMWPLGRWKWRPAGGGPGEGEAFLWWMRFSVGQYVIVRPVSTLVSVIAEATGYYCLASWSPKFIHLWTLIFVSLSVTVAMYAVLQLYMPLKEPLAPYRPVLKFMCVKLVVFFMFWQESVLSFGISLEIIKSTQYMTAEEIVVGFSALLACAEMVVFSFLHVKAFTYLPYRALAPPIPLDGHLTLPGDGAIGDDEKAPMLDPSTPLTFAEWDNLERIAAAREKALSRLAKPKLPRDSLLPPTKPDGSPLLQQTKQWPALLTCLNFADLGSEIVKEARFVGRGGRIEMTDERLLDVRKDDLEAMLGSRREERRAGRGTSGYDLGGVARAEDTPLERDLRRVRDGGAAPRGAKVGADGTLLLPPTNPSKVHVNVFDPGRGAERPHAGSAWSGWDERNRRGEEEEPERKGWWRSMRRFESRGRSSAGATGTFDQLPRLDYSAVSVADVPTLTAQSSLALPAPHQLSPLQAAHSQSTSTPSALRTSASLSPPRSAGSSQPVEARKFASSSSADSGGHVPRDTLRPTSYVPPPAKTPSPPPFSGVPIASLSPVSPPTLAPPPPVLVFANPESRRSQGLPPGAAPTASR
ncbi:hypothetical protein JCM8097_005808 [Rhodosporidiobolus ruineniae]